MQNHALKRRSLLSVMTLPLIGACSTPLPLMATPPNDAKASQRLRDSADAHGLEAYRQLTDINVSYDGQWRPLVNRIQPDVVDAGYRGRSQERMLSSAGITAQAYTGPKGHKQVVWRRGTRNVNDLGNVSVWLDGVRTNLKDVEQASALVAEGYGLFLLGPLWLNDRGLHMQQGGTELVNGRLCDVIDVWISPGLGRVDQDRVAMCIDRLDSVTRRMRFTLEGFSNTRGAVAEVDTFDHQRRFGVLWPMRSFERVVHPISLPAHDWHITGLDVNRGYSADEIIGPVFRGAAARPAASV